MRRTINTQELAERIGVPASSLRRAAHRLASIRPLTNCEHCGAQLAEPLFDRDEVDFLLGANASHVNLESKLVREVAALCDPRRRVLGGVWPAP